MAIYLNEIHRNPNAPEGANGVYLYNTDAAQGLTLGQLMAAVCLRSGAGLERQSVTKMNQMTQQNEAINRLSEVLNGLAAQTIGSSNWSAVRSELIHTYGLEAVLLPEGIDTYDTRMQAMNAVKQNLEARTQQAQRDMIDLQTLINRRDVAFTTSTNLIRALGQTSTNLAGKLTR